VVPRALVERLYARAQAGRWQLRNEKFGDALRRAVTQNFRGTNPSVSAVDTFLESLRLEDLALACACAEGLESAWEHFVRKFRPALYAAARAIAGESSSRELADSLYAELYGATQSATPESRRSLFVYFHGRSKLSTWLRAVLAQRHVDALRAGRRMESLDSEEAAETPEIRRATSTPARAEPLDPERSRYLALLQKALTDSLAALDAQDRLRLSYYYLQDLTLAQIGRLMGEHEATVSRKLERARRDVRAHVERALRDAAKLNEAQIALCLQYAQEEWHFDLTGALTAQQTEDPGAAKG